MHWKTLILYILPQHLLSRLAGWLSRRRNSWFKNYSICWFIRRYGVNLQEVAVTDLAAYPTFNDFFSRRLRADVRPLPSDLNAIASPVDGEIGAAGNTQANTLIQAKGHDYLLADLLANPELIALFPSGASYCTQYLAPQYYHRIHMPMTGTLKRMVYVPGRLFAVNRNSVAQVSGLFAHNERVICHFETTRGPMVVILVGAYLVGHIHTQWHGKVTPCRPRKPHTWTYTDKPAITLERGQELGYFTLGSTVITLFPQNTIEWKTPASKTEKVNMGSVLAYSRSMSE